MAANWPATLPTIPEIADYSETLGDGALRSDMDAGPAKVRRRFTAAVGSLQFPMTLTLAQLQELKTFYKTTLQYGTLTFYLPDPITAGDSPVAYITCRFKEPPSWRALGNRLYRTTIALEVLP